MGNVPVSAQDADFLDALAGKSSISLAETAYLLEILSGAAPPDTPFEETRYDRSSSDPVRVDHFSALLAETLGIRRSIMARLTGYPRYAVRDLRDARVLPREIRRFPAGATLSGEEALRVIGRAASLGESSSLASRVDPARTELLGRRAPGGPVYFEWDLLVDATGESDLDGEVRISSRSVAEMSVVLGARTQINVDIGVDLGDDAQELVLPEASLVRYIEPFSGESGAAGRFVLGRQPIRDLSTRLYEGPLDAFSLSLYRGVLAGEVLLGYTGAIPAAEIDPAFTVDDRTDRKDRLAGPGDRATGRYIGNLGVLFPELLGRQTPFVQVTAQIDEETSTGDDTADRLDVLYGTIGVRGSLSRSQFYEAYSILSMSRYRAGELGPADREGTGWLIGSSWRWYPEDALRSRIELEMVIASGDDDVDSPLGISGGTDRFLGFVPALGRTPWSAYDGILTNVAVLRGRWSVRPVDIVLLEASLAGLARLHEGATGSELIDPASSNRLLGMESGARIGIRPARDLILDINSSIFWPVAVDAGGAYRAERNPTGTVALDVTIQL